jgi:hypothetical protein
MKLKIYNLIKLIYYLKPEVRWTGNVDYALFVCVCGCLWMFVGACECLWVFVGVPYRYSMSVERRTFIYVSKKKFFVSCRCRGPLGSEHASVRGGGGWQRTLSLYSDVHIHVYMHTCTLCHRQLSLPPA